MNGAFGRQREYYIALRASPFPADSTDNDDCTLNLEYSRVSFQIIVLPSGSRSFQWSLANVSRFYRPSTCGDLNLAVPHGHCLDPGCNFADILTKYFRRGTYELDDVEMKKPSEAARDRYRTSDSFQTIYCAAHCTRVDAKGTCSRPSGHRPIQDVRTIRNSTVSCATPNTAVLSAKGSRRSAFPWQTARSDFAYRILPIRPIPVLATQPPAQLLPTGICIPHSSLTEALSTLWFQQFIPTSSTVQLALYPRPFSYDARIGTQERREGVNKVPFIGSSIIAQSSDHSSTSQERAQQGSTRSNDDGKECYHPAAYPGQTSPFLCQLHV
ncbi:9965_t:CDS:2 [Acaulospora colombiana]|uniref:9965_t:CDS:1 n=1 Tax=Acaulospora colombiana TaxID=27376 RepID=A0ACA9LKU6_9GLOM|nr:9965_t:CDS:2 [Acaulospora colombiana]